MQALKTVELSLSTSMSRAGSHTMIPLDKHLYAAVEAVLDETNS
jgi:hypothetical protein